jgi:hypothetical protein
MPSFLWCFALEWGVGFLVGAIIVLVAFCVGFGRLTWYVLSWWSRRRRDQQPVEVSFGEWRIKIPQALSLALIILFVYVLPIGAIGLILYFKYEDIEKAYAVNMDLRTAPETLDEVAAYYRASTPVRIKISDAAKKVSIKGEYGGLCVADFFESICRQYDSQISCKPPSPWNRTLTIDVEK